MFVFIKRAHIGNIAADPMKKTIASKRGLTLIEVLIALVIITVGVSSLMGAMASCLGVVRTARNREVARGLIRRVEVENPIDRKKIAETTESGGFEDVEGYDWSREILLVDEEERPGLFLVTTRVRWSERGRDTFEEITTYNYAPESENLTREF
jgi:prepilin-type N-terminal cleavage/methylation domain-containing protein